MHSAVFVSILAAATLSAAAPVAPVDPTVCNPNKGFFQSCSNGFKGCCKTDACVPNGWCADYKFGTYEAHSAPAPISTPAPHHQPEPVSHGTVVSTDPTDCAPNKGFFQSCSNGFKGCCKTDACTPNGWCADYKFGTYEARSAPAPAPHHPEPVSHGTVVSNDPTYCAPNKGFFQSCSNGFKGCCKTDACTPNGWCADYKFGTYEAHSAPAPAPAPVHKPVADEPYTAPSAPAPHSGSSDLTMCAANTGYYQACSNGFKGCCKQDACTLGYCPGY